MAGSVFEESKDFLLELREALVEKDQVGKELNSLKSDHKKILKTISSEEKSIDDEIASTIKKRKQEISRSYDNQLGQIRSKRKKVSNDRSKKKTKGMNALIDDETKDLRRETKDISSDLKKHFRRNGVPTYCASELYYVMFMPHGIKETMLSALCYVVYFLGIPGILTFLISSFGGVSGTAWKAFFTVLFVLLQFVVYFAIYNATKGRHRGPIEEGRELIDSLKANKNEIKSIRKEISRDTDESYYELDVFDEKLANLDDEADRLTADKTRALNDFEDEAKDVIIEEINKRRLPKLYDLQDQSVAIDEKLYEVETRFNAITNNISKEYAAYVGDEFCRIDRIDSLISILENNEADSVSSAIAFYKGRGK